MHTRRIFIKGGLLSIFYSWTPAFPEAIPSDLEPPVLSEEMEDRCISILSDALINDATECIYYHIITALGEMGNAACIPLLMGELNNPDRELEKEMIAYYLAKSGEPRGKAYLLESLKSSDCVVKRNAVNFLGALYGFPIPVIPEKEESTNPEELKKKIKALRDSNDPVDRFEVLRLMGKSGNPSYIPYLQGMLWDDLVGHAAPLELYRLGDPAIIPFLMKSLNGKNGYEAESAFSSLCEIGEESFIPALKRALKIYEEDRRNNIMSLYRSQYDVHAKRGLLKDYLYDDDPDVRLQAAIGCYYKEEPAFYRRDDLSIKRLFMDKKMVSCGKEGGICEADKCLLLEIGRQYAWKNWGILFKGLYKRRRCEKTEFS